MNQHSLLSMRDVSTDDIFSILNDARLFDGSRKDWQLPMQNALVANLFFEPSTRTHFSFESAQYQLGCQVADFNTATSSVTKGESLYDTVKTFEMIGYGCVVIRHPEDEYFKQLENIHIPIVNAGDGAGNHPSQCLLDLLTMYNEFGMLSGLHVVITGDILHSRVAASNKETLERLGSTVVFTGPEEWQRPGYPTMDFDKAVEWADVVMMLRIQKERGAAISGMDNGEYLEKYGLTKTRYERMKENAIICHPAPVNRGVEIDTDLVEAKKSRIFLQMHNGMLVRKAIMKRAFGFEPFKEQST